MSKLYGTPLLIAGAGLLSVLFSSCSLANNGLNLSGYGGESEAMGGADVAVSRDTFAVNANPAGLTQTKGQMFDLYVSEFNTVNTHTDQNGNYRKNGNLPFGGWGAIGYARHFDDSSLTAGLGFFVQGGSGFSYKNLNTPFSNAGVAPRDEITSVFSVLKLAPALGWKVNDQWSLGATMALNYAAASQQLFPNTSATVPFAFTGLNFKDASGMGLSARLGLQYRPSDDLTFGIVYGSPTRIPIKNGTLRVNYSAFGAGMVRYDDAQLKGFKLPQELTAGFAWRPTKPLLISVEEKWFDWSVLQDLTLIAKNPRSNNPVVQPVITITSPVRLHDQHVIAIGFAYDYSETTTLMGGYNYGRRAIPDENLSPVFALIQAPHYMLGINQKIDPQWNFIGAAEYVGPRQQVTNPTNSPLFGTNMTEQQYGLVLHFMVSRRW
jgi:long-chain fatty acid transport protein